MVTLRFDCLHETEARQLVLNDDVKLPMWRQHAKTFENSHLPRKYLNIKTFCHLFPTTILLTFASKTACLRSKQRKVCKFAPMVSPSFALNQQKQIFKHTQHRAGDMLSCGKSKRMTRQLIERSHELA
jgi:hypothetical protein